MKDSYIRVIEQIEKENYRLKCYYNTCIKLLDYQFCNEENKFNNIQGKKIYIYGCGDIGKRYHKSIQNSTEVIAFIDQSATENQYKYEDIDVISLDKIDNDIDFDYIVITLEDIYQVIYEDLIKNGIENKKIKSIDEMIN